MVEQAKPQPEFSLVGEIIVWVICIGFIAVFVFTFEYGGMYLLEHANRK